MSNYRRLISYIYAYEGGIKGKNIGFAKIEARGTQCKITVNVKKVYVGGNDIGVYLLAGEQEILLGNIFVRGGSGEFRTVVSVGDVEHSGILMDQCYGLTVHDVENTWRSYTTIWEDAVAHAAELDLADTLSEKAGAKNAVQEAQIKKAIKEIEEEFPLVGNDSNVLARVENGAAPTEGNMGGETAPTRFQRNMGTKALQFKTRKEVEMGNVEERLHEEGKTPKEQVRMMGEKWEAEIQGKEVERAAGVQEREAERAAGVQGREVERAAGVQGREAERAAGVQGREVERAAEVQGREAERAAEIQGKEAEGATGIQGREAERVAEVQRKGKTEAGEKRFQTEEEVGAERFQTPERVVPTVREQLKVFAESARGQSKTGVDMIKSQAEPFTQSQGNAKAAMEQEPAAKHCPGAAGSLDPVGEPRLPYYAPVQEPQAAGREVTEPVTDRVPPVREPFGSRQEPMRMLWKDADAADKPQYQQNGYGYSKMPAVEFASELTPNQNYDASRDAWNAPYLFGYGQGQPRLNGSEAAMLLENEGGVYGNDTAADPFVNGGYGYAFADTYEQGQEEKRIFGTMCREYGDDGASNAVGEIGNQSWEFQPNSEEMNLQENQEIQGNQENYKIYPEGDEGHWEVREYEGSQELQKSQASQPASDSAQCVPESGQSATDSAQCVPESGQSATDSGQSAPDSGLRQAATDSRQEPGNPAELAHLLNIGENDTCSDDQLWENLKRTHTKVLDFDYEKGCEILTIKPQDIGLLPREVWVYGNNSFLLHGYYNFRYLILAKLFNPEGGPRYLLGVPGHFYSNEKYMASMFGFPDFVLSKNQPMEDGRFGYWYTDIQMCD